VGLLVKLLEMLFNVCGSQGSEILCGNWELWEPFIHLPMTSYCKGTNVKGNKMAEMSLRSNGNPGDEK
jgi:hypothetical protein